MSAPALLMEPRDRRRAGNLLLVFGLVGTIVLGGLFLALGYAALRVDSSVNRLVAARDQVVLILDHASAALTTAGGITGNLSETVTHVSAAVDGGSEVAAQLSATTSSLSDTASSFGILGQHPFAGVSDGLQQTSATLAEIEPAARRRGLVAGRQRATGGGARRQADRHRRRPERHTRSARTSTWTSSSRFCWCWAC